MRRTDIIFYYDRNEDMQNYMVDHKSGESSGNRRKQCIFEKTGEVLERRQTKKTKENGRFAWLSKNRSASGDPADPSGDGKARKAGAGTAAFAKKDSGGERKGDFCFQELLPGLRRAGSVAATFVVLFALIFGFTQLNRIRPRKQALLPRARPFLWMWHRATLRRRRPQEMIWPRLTVGKIMMRLRQKARKMK